MNLSGVMITHHLKHEPSAEAEPTHLHHRGFSTCACYHAQLWALTPLFSPLPTEVGGIVSVVLSRPDCSGGSR